MYRYLRAFVLLCVLMQFFPLFAQFPVIRNFTPSEYSGATKNWCVAETPDHYVAVANNSGLLLYNGVKWHKAAIPNNTNVHAVLCSGDGKRLYAGAFEEFGFFENVNPLDYAPYVSLSAGLPQSERQFHDIWSIAELPDGKVVFQSDFHIFIYDVADNTVGTLCVKDKISGMRLLGPTLYVFSMNGIYVLAGKELLSLEGSEELAKFNIRDALFADDGYTPLFVSRSDGFFKLEGGRPEKTEIAGLSDAIKGVNVFHAVENNAWIAIGTVGHGLVAYEKKSGRVHRINRLNGLRNNTVLNILIDSDNNMWAALDNGLSYIIFDSPFRTLFSDNDGVGTGYASMPHDGFLYLGSNQGLYHISMPGQISDKPFKPVEVKGVSGQIWALSEIDGILLCGADAGAFEIEGSVARPIEGLGGTWGFRKMTGREGLVLASCYDGFSILEKDSATNSYKRIARVEGIGEGTCNFEVDSDGSVWFSHWLQGVYHFRLSADFKRAVDTEVFNSSNSLPADDNNLVAGIDGKIYLSSADGFRIYDRTTSSLKKVRWLDALFPPCGVSTRITQTRCGDLWAYRPDFLAYGKRLESGFEIRPFHFQSTVRRLQMNLGNMSFLPDGQTVMNQDDGFFVVGPDFPTPGARDVRMDFIRPVSTRGEVVDELYYCNNHSGGSFVFPNNRNSLYFEYSMPEYRDPNAVLFSTMVEGYDPDWTSFSPLNYRELTQMPPGNYTMHIRAQDIVTGNVSETSVGFKVEAAWHQTWWAKVLLLVSVVLLVYIVIELLKRRIRLMLERKRMAREKERREEEARRRLAEENAAISESNKRLNQEIKKKSGELADSDIHIQRKTDVLNEVRRRLDEVIVSAPDNTPVSVLEKIRRVIQSLRFHAADDANWERIEDNFNIVFDNLLRTLLKKYPNLTRNDIKVCSYLRMNLSTKEIASLMNITERSVESTRYRLRKRLGMSSGQTFMDFFNTLESES